MILTRAHGEMDIILDFGSSVLGSSPGGRTEIVWVERFAFTLSSFGYGTYLLRFAVEVQLTELHRK